ncbi:hypothetical protein BABINDRAFT_162027 [Babjeviella inositovora NRRL Y-12698]|uniref:Uncharacterized protein n=1 Tax=Babjeviella inositovora NRRL Y-12698 TaxID=984486 RepID=A0A1E3QQA9_9ASCO|nr:uncharacterized protein BABINDRAFT_162027 [Babjeviella inositovora NRRL Y-12698]ODQ79654.1 hypothetical protein BABINDRAFT_162027 [Babjeviella inositovora NRRL Y-12698]
MPPVRPSGIPRTYSSTRNGSTVKRRNRLKRKLQTPFWGLCIRVRSYFTLSGT